MDSLPSEILTQILDDQSLGIEDLAIIARVSRRWHEVVIPKLYERYTFRYPVKEPGGNVKLQAFLKYGANVRYVTNAHI